MKTKSDFILLLHKQLTGQISPEEEVCLEEWLKESDHNRQYAAELRLAWELADVEEQEVPAEILEEDYHRLMERVSWMDEQDSLRQIDHYRKFNVYKYPAIFLLLLLSAWAVYHLYPVGDQRDNVTAGTVLKIGNDRQEMLLPDSSMVFFNGNADFSYQESAQRREVNLSGLAFFEVARDEHRPFVIHLPKAIVKVLGTSFLVKAVPGEPFEVSVESGKVEVQYQGTIFQLAKGEQLKVSPDSKPQLQLNDDPNYLSWKNNLLVFRKTPLKEVIPALERHYGISISVDTPNILSCSFTGTFEDVKLEELLEIMSYSLQISVDWIGVQKISLSGRSCHSE